MKLVDAVEEFIVAKQASGRAPRTIGDYRRVLYPFAEWCREQGVGDIASLSRGHVRRYVVHLREKKWAETTVAIHVRYLRAFLNWCHKEGVMEANLAQAVQPPKLPPPEVNPPDPGEVEALLSTCDDSFLGLRDRAIILTLLDTGLRVGELCNLEMSGISIDGNRTTIELVDPKSRQRKFCFLQEEATDALKKYLKLRGNGSGPLFLERWGRRGIMPSGIWKMLRRRAEMAGVPPEKVRPHSFRKAFATWWLRAGGDERSLMQLGGWKSRRTLKHYVEAAKVQELEEQHRRFSPVRQLNLKG